MEEELNENDLEERLYAMIHHVDGTQAEENDQTHDVSPRVEEAPRSTVKRYWRTSHNSAYQKVNTPTAPTKNTQANRTPANVNKNTPAPVNRTHAAATDDPKPKEEKNDAPESPPAALAILQNTVPQNYTKTVEILEIDEPSKVLDLESSDEDEVIEIALPPKPTITIESSDEDEVIIQNPKTKGKVKNSSKENKSPNKSNRDVSASPVPSVVSSMSDDFIRGDCIALNISSAQLDNQSFDFSLHGSDLIGGDTPSKKKKKKKNKDRLTSTPISEKAVEEINTDNIFATPKSKAKNKKPKAKSYTVSEKTIPNPDVYDSDSNQSVIDINKNHDAYVVTDKSFPSTDVYESDSSVAETIRDVGKQPSPQRKTKENDSSDIDLTLELPSNTKQKNVTDKTLVVDLTNDYTTLDSTQIEENIVIGNISGYSDVNEYGDSLMNTSNQSPEELGRFCSTKVPQILYEDLDFDNLKGKDKVCRRRRYSLTTLRAEMEKFYNESWGGENFNHQEIQKNMSRDKSLWVIDPKDRMPNPPKRRVTCNYCNRVGHRDDTCRLKPPVCHMCGHTGHYEPRCPRKICVNCGSPNFMYSTSCRNCASWRSLQCAACGQPGHPADHCPDVWRGYHNTIDENLPLEQCGEKPHHQLQCSGCARRGHLAHACRAYRALCPLPLHPSRVTRYLRLYPPTTNKRTSKCPPAHETHVTKKRNMSENESRPRKNSETENRKNSEADRTRKNSQSAEPKEGESEAADFIPVGPNLDKEQVLQDNEVSDTSEVKTSARIYLTFGVMRRFSTPAGQGWLKKNMEELNVDVQYSNASSFLTVVGTVGDQEAFHSKLREWSGRAKPANNPDPQNDDPQTENMMPRRKNVVLRRLSDAFESLKGNLGDPKAIFKELTFLQNRHETIKSQKEISPKQLSNSRGHINEMLKKLNMVLLGQAGLAGGAEHLNALHYLQEKVINTRNQKIPHPLRSEITQHYQTIFTALPRNDYADLVKKFYSTRVPQVCVGKGNIAMNSPGPKKKKKKKLKIDQQKPVVTPSDAIEEQPVTPAEQQQQQPIKTSRQVKDMTKKLSYFYTQLLKASQPSQNEGRDMKRLKIAYKILETKNNLRVSGGPTRKQQMEKLKVAWKVLREATAFLNRKPQINKKKKLVRE